MKHVPRFYLEAELYHENIVRILPRQMHHITVVLRFSVGSTIRLFNYQSGEWDCEIIDVRKCLLKCKFIFRNPRIERGPVIACSLINPKRFDFLLEKITELGASEIIPIISHYTQYKGINLGKARQKIIQACEQSQRLSIPVLHEIAKIEKFLYNRRHSGKILVGNGRFSGLKLKDAVEEQCTFLIGPEGGFSDEEYDLFEKLGGLCMFYLGENVLRSETAAIAFISVWNSMFS